MDQGIATMESGVCQLKLEGTREQDGTLTLADGTNIADWPDTITLVSGTVMRLSNVPYPTVGEINNPEIAWYEL
jgi:hypothetical protein